MSDVYDGGLRKHGWYGVGNYHREGVGIGESRVMFVRRMDVCSDLRKLHRHRIKAAVLGAPLRYALKKHTFPCKHI